MRLIDRAGGDEMSDTWTRVVTTMLYVIRNY